MSAEYHRPPQGASPLTNEIESLVLGALHLAGHPRLEQPVTHDREFRGLDYAQREVLKRLVYGTLHPRGDHYAALVVLALVHFHRAAEHRPHRAVDFGAYWQSYLSAKPDWRPEFVEIAASIVSSWPWSGSVTVHSIRRTDRDTSMLFVA